MDEEGHLTFDLDGRIMPGECTCRHPESHFVERVSHVAIEEAKEPQHFELPALGKGALVPSPPEQIDAIQGVDYGWAELQAWFDEHRPLGMCNACTTRQRGHEQAGEPPEPPESIHAAVTVVAVVQNITMDIPGMGRQTMPTVLSLPSCLYCPAIIHHSKLTSGSGGPLSY